MVSGKFDRTGRLEVQVNYKVLHIMLIRHIGLTSMVAAYLGIFNGRLNKILAPKINKELIIKVFIGGNGPTQDGLKECRTSCAHVYTHNYIEMHNYM